MAEARIYNLPTVFPPIPCILFRMIIGELLPGGSHHALFDNVLHRSAVIKALHRQFQDILIDAKIAFVFTLLKPPLLRYVWCLRVVWLELHNIVHRIRRNIGDIEPAKFGLQLFDAEIEKGADVVLCNNGQFHQRDLIQAKTLPEYGCPVSGCVPDATNCCPSQRNSILRTLPSGAVSFRMIFLNGVGTYIGTAHFGARPVRSRMTPRKLARTS